MCALTQTHETSMVAMVSKQIPKCALHTSSMVLLSFITELRIDRCWRHKHTKISLFAAQLQNSSYSARFVLRVRLADIHGRRAGEALLISRLTHLCGPSMCSSAILPQSSSITSCFNFAHAAPVAMQESMSGLRDPSAVVLQK